MYKNMEKEKLDYFLKNSDVSPIDAENIIARTEAKIAARQQAVNRRGMFFYRLAVAASVALIIGVSLMFMLNKNNAGTNSDLLALANESADFSTNEVMLVTENQQIEIEENTRLEYNGEGKALVSPDDIIRKEEISVDKTAYDQIIVPSGKRSKIILADGTQVWVNSRSKVVYPRTFDGDERKIFVQGEVYLEVTHDAKHPFIVTSNDFDLKVLGTKFNITNYGNAPTNIVLVEGKVEVKTQKTESGKQKAEILLPDELLSIAGGEITEKRKVDAGKYTSWMYNTLIADGENLSVIARKLENYFGVKINYSPELAGEKVYGRLDLKENLTDIIESIQFSIPMTVEKNGNEIQLKTNS